MSVQILGTESQGDIDGDPGPEPRIKYYVLDDVPVYRRRPSASSITWRRRKADYRIAEGLHSQEPCAGRTRRSMTLLNAAGTMTDRKQADHSARTRDAHGVFLDECLLNKSAVHVDAFDLICHVAFDQPRAVRVAIARRK